MIITAEEKTQRAANETVSREHEAYDYQNNINRYTAMLEGMPEGELPADLIKYKGVAPEKIPATVSLADALLVADHDFRDSLKVSIRCESIQKAKVDRIRIAVESELPTDAADREAVIAAAVERRATALIQG